MPHTITDLSSQGTLLQISISSTYTTLGQRVSLEGVDPELKIRDVTNLDSLSTKKRPGIPDLGKMSGKLYYDPNDATHIYVRARVTSPPAVPDLWKMIYPDGSSAPANDAFSGYVTKFKPTGIEVNGTLEADFEIDVTDNLTITAGDPTS